MSAFAQDTNADPLVTELDRILDGRVGPRFSDEEYAQLVEEGKRRIERRFHQASGTLKPRDWRERSVITWSGSRCYAKQLSSVAMFCW